MNIGYLGLLQALWGGRQGFWGGGSHAALSLGKRSRTGGGPDFGLPAGRGSCFARRGGQSGPQRLVPTFTVSFLVGRVPLLKKTTEKRSWHPYSNLSNLEDLGSEGKFLFRLGPITRSLFKGLEKIGHGAVKANIFAGYMGMGNA